MRIAALAICRNEEQFVERWAQSIREADCVILADTGSTDDTIKRAPDFVQVKPISIRPWRFDLARNAALALVPADVDVVVNMDLDEVLLPGWRAAVEAAFADESVTRLFYPYIWSWKDDGSPGVRFYRDMIHRRFNYMWRHPCHETLYFVGDGERKTERIHVAEDVRLEHHADASKSRGQYLPLLELAVKEDPNNDRMAHYYARELFYYKRWDEAIAEFERHLALPSALWNAERAQSQIYISKCYAALEDKGNAEKFARLSIVTNPHQREPFLQAARLAYHNAQWRDCLYFAEKALEIENPPMTYTNSPEAWGSDLPDIGGVAAFQLGRFDLAHALVQQALELRPDDERLHGNKRMIEEKLAAIEQLKTGGVD